MSDVLFGRLNKMPTIWINKLKTRFAKANKEIIRMEKKAHERIMSSTI